MLLRDVAPFKKIRIVAEGDFYAFVDGLEGHIVGMNNGLVEVSVLNALALPITLFVPPGELLDL